MSLLGVGMRFVRIWTPDESGSLAPKLLSEPSRCAKQLEDCEGPMDLGGSELCEEVQEEGQGWWAAKGHTAEHPEIQDRCQSGWHVSQVIPGSAAVGVHKTHRVRTGMVMEEMHARISDTAVTGAFCWHLS